MGTLMSNHRGSLVGSVLAVFLALHGVAHFVGVSGNVGSIVDNDKVDLLGGAVTTSSDVALGALAAAWAVIGVGFLVVSILVWRRMPSARRALVAVSVASLSVGVVNLWEGVAGVVINVVLIALAVAMPQAFGLSRAQS